MIEIFDISYDEIELIQDLWEKNRQYHEHTSEHFPESYRMICFDQRMKAFGVLDPEMLKITVAKKNEEYIGYCLSTVQGGTGEIASLHVDQASRGVGIGKELVVRHVEWLTEKNCNVIGVTVSQENASTIRFYQNLGFFPNTLYMQRK